VGYTQHAMFFSCKKNARLAFAATWMDFEEMTLSELSMAPIYGI
jgi:hypothetical protein